MRQMITDGSKMKVALFLPTLRGGGAERVMVHLAEGLSDRGVGVEIVLATAEGVFLTKVPCDVRVVDLHVHRVYCALPRLIRYLKEEKPDVLLSALSHANLVAVIAAQLADVRAVVTVHNTLSAEIDQARNLRTRWVPWLVRILYRWADGVVAVSDGVAEDLVHCTSLPREKITVIYNPVVTSDLYVQAEEFPRHPWFASGEPPVILGVGRLTAAKDFSTLIHAFALVRREREARLMILGEGEERPRLEALLSELGLEDEVSLPGFLENPYTYMKRAHVFVLSSKWEGLPTVLIEALALGAPVVATDCPSGPAEILEDGKWGRLVPVGDDAALAEAILATLAEPRQLQAAQQRMQERFGLEAVVEQYLDVLGLR